MSFICVFEDNPDYRVVDFEYMHKKTVPVTGENGTTYEYTYELCKDIFSSFECEKGDHIFIRSDVERMLYSANNYDGHELTGFIIKDGDGTFYSLDELKEYVVDENVTFVAQYKETSASTPTAEPSVTPTTVPSTIPTVEPTGALVEPTVTPSVAVSPDAVWVLPLGELQAEQ